MNNNYQGMTVNERLYVSGLLPLFDKAVSDKNIETIKEILNNVGLPEDDISEIIRSIKLS